MGEGRVGEAYEAAKAVLETSLAASEDAYDGAAYDIAMAHVRLGRVLQMGGAAEAALTPIAEARRRFQRLAEAGDQSAARMASVCLTESGDCLRDLGRLDEAATAYEEAIELDKQRGDPRDVAAGKGQLGTVRMLSAPLRRSARRPQRSPPDLRATGRTQYRRHRLAPDRRWCAKRPSSTNPPSRRTRSR